MSETFPPVLAGIALPILVLAVTALGRRLPVPTPVLQLIAGLLVGLVPGAAGLRLDPGVVFFVFLPPVLWSAAYFTSFRDFKANLRPILLLAVGLVLVTTVVVALVAHALLPDSRGPSRSRWEPSSRRRTRSRRKRFSNGFRFHDGCS